MMPYDIPQIEYDRPWYWHLAAEILFACCAWIVVVIWVALKIIGRERL